MKRSSTDASKSEKKQKRIRNQEMSVRSSGIPPSETVVAQGHGGRTATVEQLTGGTATSSASSSILPRHIMVTKVMEERKFEIQAMEKAISNASEHTGAIRIFQTIKRYQRRRAASHNVKRLPSYIRQRALNQMAKDPEKPRALTRKVRRTPRRLQEFKTKESAWLETHLWHAKRMKIRDLYGFKVPVAPNQKSSRSLYRAACYESVIYDDSHSKVVEVEGDVELICKAFRAIADPTIASIGAKHYINGSKAGTIFLHDYLQFPQACICEVTFLWKQSELGKTTDKNGLLWIWAPLGSFDAVYTLIRATLEKITNSLKNSSMEVRKVKDLIKFQFTGPRSHAVLFNCLSNEPTSTHSLEIWNILKVLPSSAAVPHGAVFALEVNDPRVAFPRLMAKRQLAALDKTLESPEIISVLSTWPSNLGSSRIWDPKHRNDLFIDRPTNQSIEQRRSKVKLPGTPLAPTETDAVVPVLLIKRGDSGDASSGWDFITPKGWGMPFWNLFSFAGVRMAGLKNMADFKFESQLPSFPEDFPECPLYNSYSKGVAEGLQARYDKTPPGKRVNFEKKGVSSPFQPSFWSLLNLENSDTSSLFCFHSSKSLQVLRHFLSMENNNWDEFTTCIVKGLKDMIKGIPISKEMINLSISSMDHCLVKVKVFLELGSVICNSKIHFPGEASLALDSKVDPDSVIGFTTSGGFSLSLGKSFAIGSITLKGLYLLLKDRGDERGAAVIVMIRSPKSRKSRNAKLMY